MGYFILLWLFLLHILFVFEFCILLLLLFFFGVFVLFYIFMSICLFVCIFVLVFALIYIHTYPLLGIYICKNNFSLSTWGRIDFSAHSSRNILFGRGWRAFFACVLSASVDFLMSCMSCWVVLKSRLWAVSMCSMLPCLFWFCFLQTGQSAVCMLMYLMDILSSSIMVKIAIKSYSFSKLL